jgi:hypothetical protein
MFCCPVWVKALRWADPPPKESYCEDFQNLVLNWNRPESLIPKAEEEEEEEEEGGGGEKNMFLFPTQRANCNGLR